MERRTKFGKEDIVYLANICHDCQDCYQACPYTPPHELAINIPRLLSEVRLTTYREYAFPRVMSRAFERHKTWAIGLSLACLLLAVGAALLVGPASRLLALHQEPGSFYDIFPYADIVIAGVAVGAVVLAIYLHDFFGFISAVRQSKRTASIGAFLGAARDVLTHGGFRGGGAGCTHDEMVESRKFLLSHLLMFYGFLSALAATILAAVIQDGFGIMPPYPLISFPVLFGTAGGVMMVYGSLSVAYCKLAGTKVAVFDKMSKLDFVFLQSLALVSITGFLTLVFRETAFLGVLFTIHMGLVLAMFVTAPYGKFIHFVLRYASLVVNRLEIGDEVAHQ